MQAKLDLQVILNNSNLNSLFLSSQLLPYWNGCFMVLQHFDELLLSIITIKKATTTRCIGLGRSCYSLPLPLATRKLGNKMENQTHEKRHFITCRRYNGCSTSH
ncbi:hypothetical protein QWZ13_17805 [Reinekea marina]|uniref:hypothetical protein n=1 Tax=Reinekea marina TaxID=1310421 RepID=UPI0025B48813|nr:hypothetical protein [Reinekea marina]MDN3650765.1 hypothetical protein [Reinekea marina]